MPHTHKYHDALPEFLGARLDEWESLGRQALPWQTGSRDEGQPPEHVSWRRSAGSVEFGLRHVATLRAIVEIHRIGYDPCDAHDASLKSVPCETLLHLAADWSTHPDYRQEWAAG